jgi:hypothetical protein
MDSRWRTRTTGARPVFPGLLRALRAHRSGREEGREGEEDEERQGGREGERGMILLSLFIFLMFITKSPRIERSTVMVQWYYYLV